MAENKLARILAGMGGIGSDARMPVAPTADDLTRTLAGTGGGIGSDARMPVAPVQRDPQLERQIQVWTMSGRQPTPEMDAYLRAIAPEKMERSERLAGRDMPLVSYPMAELSGIPQAGRAGKAIGKAVENPSIPTVTNAGAQTAFAAFRPAMALKTLGAGYTAALADDLGLFGGSEAQAQAKKQAAPKQRLPGLDDAQQAALDAAEKKLLAEDYEGPAGRKLLERTITDLRKASTDFATANADSERRLKESASTKEREEYDRAVARAEAAKDMELGRARRFQDSKVGKVWDETGGLAPMAFGAAPGIINRAAYGGGKLWPSVAEGTVAGAAAYNIPLAYDALGTPVENPEKRAYAAYARELPPTHPRRQEMADIAEKMPTKNPLREEASKELLDPYQIGKRLFFGGAEGGLGAAMGYGGTHAVAEGAKAVGRGLKSGSSRLLEALTGRPPSSATMQGPGAGIPGGAGSPLPTPSAGVGSSAEILPPMATGRQPLAERVRAPSVLPEPMIDQSGQLARTLAQDQLPAPSTASSSELVRTLASSPRRQAATSARPTWASDPPEGVKLDKGYYWDARQGQQRHEKGGYGPTAKYSVPRGKKEASPPEKPGVQVDDTRPLRYPSED